MFPQMAMLSICLSQRGRNATAIDAVCGVAIFDNVRMDASGNRYVAQVAVNPFTANVDVCCGEARGVNEHVRGE